MIALKSVQQHAVDLIAALPYFAGETVLKDSGDKESDREKALSEKGRCVMVHPILSFDKKGDGAGIVTGDATIYISIESNPKVNTGEGAKDVLEMLTNVVAALIAFNPIAADERYKLVDAPLESYDAGLLAYGPTFTKLCVI